MRDEDKCVKCGNIVQKKGCPACGGKQYMSEKPKTIRKVKSLSCAPFTLNKNTWCYERKSGIIIIHEDRQKDGKWITTHSILLPIRKIKGYLGRRLNVEVK